MLPSGTVTFLFTDIEGSTRLWEQYPQAMRRVLARHDELLRREIESHGGTVFKTVGDAFCAVFDAPSNALTAALAIQQALLAEEWGETPIRVRMALHTGQADEREGDYFGQDVNRVARLQSIGHGGQILLSEPTEQLLRNKVPQTAAIYSLGSHRLKDLGNPEHVFQVSEPGLRSDFPALNSLNTQPNNLPAQRTSFIGREAQVTAVSETLARSDVRLLTLTGPGGTGKTRLSLQVAAENLENYKDGAFFVALAPLSDPDFVLSSITQTLGVRTSGKRPLIERLKDYLVDRHMLLVLDNFEHVIEAAPIASDLLTAAPELNVLVTSRIPLQLYGERVYQVAPLNLPESGSLPPIKQLARVEAVQLFVDRATAVKHNFELTEDNGAIIAEICSRVDGLPLAIELAAARMRMFPPNLILERLENRMQFLSGAFKDLPERQRTLRATIDWSHNLLSEADQILLRRLAVFSGGTTLEATEGVCNSTEDVQGDGERTLDVLQGLENLLDHSLLRMSEDDGEPRFYMLETIREYAKERLDQSGEAGRMRLRHADFFLALAETAEPELRRAEQTAWLARLEREHDNFRAALSWLFRQDPALGLRLAATLGHFWHVHGHYKEGREWLAKLLATGASADRRTTSYAKALNRAGMLAWYQGDNAEGSELQEQAVRLWRELGEENGLAYAVQDYAKAIESSGDLPRARAIIAESVALFRKVGDEPGLVDALFWQGFYTMLARDLDKARSIAEESLARAQRIGDVTGLAAATSILGHIAYQQGNYTTAYPFYEKSLHYFREAGDLYGMIILLGSLANVSYLNADFRQAQTYLLERLQLARAIDHRSHIVESLNYLGLVSSLLSQETKARDYFDESLRACAALEETEEQATAECLVCLASLLVKEGKPAPAVQLLGAADGLLVEEGLLDAIFRGVYDQTQTAAQEQLDKEKFVSSKEAGKTMTTDQAINYALKVNSDTN